MHKYKNLDGLRGLAALVVVMWHYSLGFMPSLAGDGGAHRHFAHEALFYTTPLHLLFAGPSAVSLFFVLSGFVLSVKFFQSKDPSILTSSAVRRYSRLMIPAFGSIVITYFLLRFGFSYVKETGDITGSGWLGTLWNFPLNFFGALWQGIYTIFFGNFNPNVSYNFNLWTMHYELFGSFIVFMIMALFGKLKNRWIVYVALTIAFIQTYYLGFLMGLIIADIWSNYAWIKDRISEKICWALLPLGLFLFAYYLTGSANSIYAHLIIPSFGPSVSTIFYQTVGSVIIMISVMRLRLLSRLFELKPLQFLGINSFALYVIHLAVLGSLACFIFNHLVWKIGYKEAFLTCFFVAVPITLLISQLYTKLVDIPAINLSKKLGNTILTRDLSLFLRQPLRLLVTRNGIKDAESASATPETSATE